MAIFFCLCSCDVGPRRLINHKLALLYFITITVSKSIAFEKGVLSMRKKCLLTPHLEHSKMCCYRYFENRSYDKEV